MAIDTANTPVQSPRLPPDLSVGPIAWVRRNLFSGIGNTLITLVCIYVLWKIVPPIVDWAFVKATYQADNKLCRAGEGACWGFIREKIRLIMFGTYPFEEQWRPLLMMVILLSLIGTSMIRAFWRRWLIVLWVVGTVVMYVLMAGGVLGLSEVETTRWGGLPLTLILSVVGIVVAFPFAVLLALGRRSNLPAIRGICVAFIELIRGVPLISVLFMASFMIPLFLPAGVTVNNLLRAQTGIIIFTAAYMAEVIRGGLQAIPKGQFEAADALGLNYWQKTRKIILPQALRIVIPPMVNTFISMFKDTSLVYIVSLYDLLGATRAAANDPEWRPFYVEGLVFVAVIYFIFCFTIASYSRYIERLTNTGHKR